MTTSSAADSSRLASATIILRVLLYVKYPSHSRKVFWHNLHPHLPTAELCTASARKPERGAAFKDLRTGMCGCLGFLFSPTLHYLPTKKLSVIFHNMRPDRVKKTLGILFYFILPRWVDGHLLFIFPWVSWWSNYPVLNKFISHHLGHCSHAH